ncbi:putative reverse transcriptase domain-containing protein [Tanacetum coccineum]
MSSASSAVTSSVYTDSEPGRVFWGADEEISDGGIPRVIYIPLEDEHEFPAEEQPLPHVVSPKSPGYVTKSDLEEDPEEYEDDETEDGQVDYPIDGGDDGDDDDGDSSRDDADDEDENEEDGDEEEEHPAPTDSAVVIPTVEPVSPPEGTEPVIPPPSTNITTTGARIIVRLQASISLSPEVEVERLLAMPTPPPSPFISLSLPSAGERLARCTAPLALSLPPPVPSRLLQSSGCPTQIQTLRIASTQALIDAVTTALPSPPLPPSLYIPQPVNRRDDIPESEQPPRKRLCLSTLGSKYEMGESSTARPTGGRGVDYGFVSTVDAEVRQQGISEVGYGIRDTWVDPAEAVPEVTPMIVGEVKTRVAELAELHERDTQDLYALLEDTQDGRTRISQRGTLIQTQHQVHETCSQIQQAEMAELRETNCRRQAQTVETLRVMRDIRREMGDMHAELLALREQQRRAGQPGPDARVPDHQDASRDADSSTFSPMHIQWDLGKYSEKMTDKYCPQGEIKKLEIELWNLKVKGNDVPTYTERFQELTLICTKFVANETEKVDKYISGLPDNIYGNVKSSRPKTLDETIELANDLMDQKLRTYTERQTDNKTEVM